jgi:DeoR/GlpR family transcriptional regulator of sugar metabolism
MNTVQRRLRLISLIREQKRVSLHEIKELFDVSTMTLQRDLAMIESQGLILLCHIATAYNIL